VTAMKLTTKDSSASEPSQIGLLFASVSARRRIYTAGLQALNVGGLQDRMKEWQGPAKNGESRRIDKHGIGLIMRPGAASTSRTRVTALSWFYQARRITGIKPAAQQPRDAICQRAAGWTEGLWPRHQFWKQGGRGGVSTAGIQFGIQYIENGTGLRRAQPDGARWIGKAAKAELQCAAHQWRQLFARAAV